MQAHGGRLELTALPKGTCFSVYLPVEAEVLEAVKPAEGVKPAGSRGRSKHRKPKGSRGTTA